MRLDAAGMPLPDQPPPTPNPLWYCPDCDHPTWPASDPYGKPYARRCIACQLEHDLIEGLSL